LARPSAPLARTFPQHSMKFRVSGSAILPLAAAASLAPGFAQDDKEKVTFVDHVLPVLESACLNCHNPDEAKGGLDLTSYSATMNGGSGGAVASAGNPDASRLFTLTAHLEEPVMPPNKPKIAEAQLQVLRKWIEGGLLETKESKAKKSTGPMLAATVTVSAGKPEKPAMPEHVLLQPTVVTERPNAITALASSPWSPLVAIGGQKQVLLYDSLTLELLGIYAFPEGFPEDISFSANGSLLVAGGGRGGKFGKAVAWDVATGERVVEVGKEFDTALAAGISPDHAFMALGGPGRNLKMFDTRSGEQLHSIKKHPDWLLEVAYSPDGVLLASAGRTGDLYVWEAHSGIEFYELKSHQLAVTGISWRADSNILAACSEDGQVTTWEMQKGANLKRWPAHPGGALGIDFSPDGARIVTCGRDNRVKIWKMDGTLEREITGFTDIVTAVTFTHDGKRVVSGDWKGALVVWNADDGSKIGELISNPPSIEVQQQRAKESIAQITAQLPALEAEIKKAEEAAAAAKKAKADADGLLAGSRKTKADAEASIKGGDQLVAQADAKVKDAEGKLAASRGGLAAKQKDATDKAAAARKAITDRTAESAGKTAEAESLRKEFAAAEQQLQAKANEAAQAAQKVKMLTLQVEQLPDNPDLAQQLAAAKTAEQAAQGAVAQADGKRKELGGKIAAAEKAATDAKGQIPALEIQAKALDLVAANAAKEAAAANTALAPLLAAVDAAKKGAAEARAKVDAARKTLAAVDGKLAGQEAAAKAATDRLAPLAQAESAARAKFEKAKVDIQFARYQVDKWAAAEVNLALHGENETLGNHRETMMELDEKASTALQERDLAKNALIQAEETMALAKATIEEGNRFIDAASDNVVETGLALFAARTVGDMLDDPSNPMPVEVAGTLGPEELRRISARLPEIEKTLAETFTKVQATTVELQKASKTAAETPKVIEERTRLAREKEGTVASLMEEKDQTLRQLEEQQKKVEELRKKYEAMFYKFADMPAEKKQVDMPK